jgi:hypothetical protein
MFQPTSTMTTLVLIKGPVRLCSVRFVSFLWILVVHLLSFLRTKGIPHFHYIITEIHESVRMFMCYQWKRFWLVFDSTISTSCFDICSVAQSDFPGIFSMVKYCKSVFLERFFTRYSFRPCLDTCISTSIHICWSGMEWNLVQLHYNPL